MPAHQTDPQDSVLTDEELEVRISRAYDELVSAPDIEGRREAFARMADLVAKRSAAQISRMELERGLF